MPLEETLFFAARDLGLEIDRLNIRAVGGGDAVRAWQLHTPGRRVFLKTCPPGQKKMLADEADCLTALAKTGALRLPEILGRGQTDRLAWLALEYLQLEPRNSTVDERLGRQLAALHSHSGEQHGWHIDNHIGPSPQINTPEDSWAVFFARHRLGFQFDLLGQKMPNSRALKLKDEVIAAWRRCAENHQPQPSLLHGDLWSGNAAALEDRQPVVYDPAVHYGDRECDLAMTRLFGGFSMQFYRAYEQAWPLPPGAEERQGFYRLYHLLNHASLFGSAYVDAAIELAERLSNRF